MNAPNLKLAMQAEGGENGTRRIAAVYWDPATSGPFYVVFHDYSAGLPGGSATVGGIRSELPDAEVLAWCGIVPEDGPEFPGHPGHPVTCRRRCCTPPDGGGVSPADRRDALADWDRAVRRFRAWQRGQDQHASLEHAPLSRGERNGLSLAADHADYRAAQWGFRPPSTVGAGGVA